MKNTKKLAILASAPAIIFLCVSTGPKLGGSLFDTILAGCRQTRETLADLDARNSRHIIILGTSCWEITRSYYLGVRVNGKTVVPEHYFDSDNGKSHSYSLIYAENGSLVAVVDPKAQPSTVIFIYDFKTADGYSPNQWQRLHKEHPEIVIPNGAY